jgi:hypothetical protein
MYVTIAQLRAFTGVLPTNNFYITDVGKSGLAVFDPTDELSSDDGALVFVTAGSRRVKRVFDQKTVNSTWYGVVGDGTTDNHTTYQNAVNSGYNVYTPKGDYSIDVAMIKLTPGKIYSGDGASTRFIRKTPVITGQGGLGLFYLESSSSSELLANTVIQDMQFDGIVATLGTSQSSHLLALAGTDNTIVQRCYFTGFRADGIYVSAGRGGGTVRHNRNVTIRDCWFDGVNKNNRNGISVIDVDGIVIDNCKFYRIGNSVLSNSVGGIDFERNSGSTMYARNARITNCYFNGINTTNTSAITIFNTSTAGPEQANYFVIQGNKIDSCFWGVTIVNSVDILDGTSENSMVKIDKNQFNYNQIALAIKGRGVIVSDNDFKGVATTYPNQIEVGNGINVGDIDISRNKFQGCGASGVIQIGGFFGLKITNNVSVDGKTFLYFFPDAGQDSYRLLRGGRFTDNVIRAVSAITTNNYFMNFPSGFNANNWLINSSIVEQDNSLENRVARTPGGATYYLNRSSATSAPTTGSWDVGNLVTTATSNIICTTAGTFGTDGITNNVTATNGSAFVAYATVLASNLRQGQYITISSSSTVFKIANVAVDGSGFYISSAFDGTTGSQTTAWSAPVFYTSLIQPTTQWVTSGSNLYYTTGNVSVGTSVTTFGRFYSGDASGKGLVMGYQKNTADANVVYGQIFYGESGGSPAFTAGDMIFVPRTSTGSGFKWMTANGSTTPSIAMSMPSTGVLNIQSLTASQLVVTDASKNLVSTLTLPNNTLATTQTAGDNSTKVATTAYVATAVAAGGTGANPTALVTYTAVNGSATTYLRSDGAPKADSTVIRSVANSYSLSGMQTKLNGYGSLTGGNTWVAAQTFNSQPTFLSGLALQTSGQVIQLGAPTVTTTRIVNFPDKAGTIAMTSDLSDFVTMTTAQNISGIKTFTLGFKMNNATNQTWYTDASHYTNLGASSSPSGTNQINLPDKSGTVALTTYTSDASTTNVSKSYLNSTYPTAYAGDVVYLPAAALKYIKMDSSSTGNWDEQPYNQTP